VLNYLPKYDEFKNNNLILSFGFSKRLLNFNTKKSILYLNH
jgi:hypothetical protein